MQTYVLIFYPGRRRLVCALFMCLYFEYNLADGDFVLFHGRQAVLFILWQTVATCGTCCARIPLAAVNDT